MRAAVHYATLRRARKKKKKQLNDCHRVYVEDTGQSLHERAGEHCNIVLGSGVKHWLTYYAELREPPKFRMKFIGSYKNALSRKLSESVRIYLRGGGVHNSKTEYSRC